MKTIFEANKQIICPVLPLMKIFLLTFVALHFGRILSSNNIRKNYSLIHILEVIRITKPIVIV